MTGPRQPRVLHIIDDDAPTDAVRRLASELGQSVLRITSERGATRKLTPHNGALLLVRRRGRDAAAVLRLRTWLEELGPSLVHCWTDGVARMFAWATLGRSPTKLRKLVVTRDEHFSAVPQTVLLIDRRVLRRAAAIVAPSEAARAQAIAAGVAADRLVVIPPGVIRPRFVGLGAAAPIRAELGLPPDARLIGNAGPLVPGRRLKELIWATDQIGVIRDDVHAIILGDGPARRVLEQYARLNHIADRVHFLGRRADEAEIIAQLEVYGEVALAGGPTRGLLTALAAGVPVVATNTPGHREAVETGKTGILIPTHYRAAFGKELNRLLDLSPRATAQSGVLHSASPTLAAELGAAAAEHAAAAYSIEQFVRRHHALYNDLLGEPRRG